MDYSEAFKKKMVGKMLAPSSQSACSLQKETGLSQSTLSRWIREARRVDGGHGPTVLRDRVRASGFPMLVARPRFSGAKSGNRRVLLSVERWIRTRCTRLG